MAINQVNGRWEDRGFLYGKRSGVSSGRWYPVIKRMLDVVLSLLGIGILFLPMLLTALAVYIDDPGPVIFRQKRVGKDGRLFTLYKLRTMVVETPRYVATAELTDRDRYITRTGRFLRRTSLDEIPQLINILMGDMSLVGPRPLIPEEREIHRMRTGCGVYHLSPGITGLAQINGRDRLTPAQKLHWDVTYLHTFSFLTDLRILARTVRKVFYCEDVAESARYARETYCEAEEEALL